MNHPSPSPGFEHNEMSVSSELRPLYRLTSVKEECTEEELNSLSNLAKQVVFSFQSKTNSAHIGQECPINCPCKCHLPSPIPAVNEYRPSVIMAPVAREQRGSYVTHFPLRIQVNYKISEGRITPTSRYGKDFCIPSAISSGYTMLMPFLMRTKQLSMAATAWLIWLCACLRYWPYGGVGTCVSVLKLVLFNIIGVTYSHGKDIINCHKRRLP